MIAQRIKDNVKKHRADLLILDLRLKGEKGSITDPGQISGVQVLQKLHESKIGCPVLITTASNKMWSYKKTIYSGAFAYWVKEGLDESYKIGNTIENYLRLVDLVYTLCFSNEVKFLYRDLLPGIVSIENNETVYWWESKFWYDRNIETNKISAADKTEITDILIQAFEQFGEYLKLKIQQTINPELSKNIASLIIVQCSRILEIIHQIDVSNNSISLSTKMADQLNKEKYVYYRELVSLRNKAVHQLNSNSLHVGKFIALLLDYLNDDYTEVHEKYATRLQSPINGHTYESVIRSKHSVYDWYYIENPGLDLIGRTDIVLNSSYYPNITFNVGDKVRFKLKITENERNRNYFAFYATVIESAQ